MAGYTRSYSKSTGNTIEANDFNTEFQSIDDAFSEATGHTHDGSVDEGGYVPLISDADNKNAVELDSVGNSVDFFVEVATVKTAQLSIEDGAILPATTNDIDLGSATFQFKSMWIDGVAHIDSLGIGTEAVVATDILDEDNMASDSATALATQQSIKAYVDTEITTAIATKDQASEITYSNATSGLAATDTQAAIDEVEGRLDTAESNITTANTNHTNHLNDTTDAHDASAISYVNVTSGLTATDAQAAIDEVDGDLDAHIAATAAHGATGAVVGTTNTQTLTNKTINTASNTITINEADISNLGATIVLDSDIGSTVQGYDADIPTVAASQAEMEAGTETALRSMSPLRVAQAIAANAASTFPKAIQGLVPSTAADADHDITISTGSAVADDDATLLELTAAITKQIDATWATGNNSGGLFSGTVAADTTYHLFIIEKDSDGSIDAGFDTSVTAANIPSGYTAYRRIASFITDASSNLIPFTGVETGNGTLRLIYTTPIMDILVDPSGTSLLTYAITIPSDIYFMPDFIFGTSGSGTNYHIITSSDQVDIAPSSVYHAGLLTTNSTKTFFNFPCPINDATVRIRGSADFNGLYGTCYGYTDFRN